MRYSNPKSKIFAKIFTSMSIPRIWELRFVDVISLILGLSPKIISLQFGTNLSKRFDHFGY